MQVDVLRENDNYIEALQTATHSADFGLDNLPALLVKVIKENRWQERYVRSLNRVVTFDSFTAFAVDKVPAGLGTSVDMLKRMCRDETPALDALDQATQNQPSLHISNTAIDNVQGITTAPTGNAADTALRRLRKDAPELHGRVLAGEISPHAAMVEAGFRTKSITIPVDPERAARAILRAFDRDQVSELIACLYDGIGGAA